MALNRGQQTAYDEIIAFLLDPNRKYHAVSGDAGTGKTFLIAAVIKDLLKYLRNNPKIAIDEIVLTASTNKAAAVVAENVLIPGIKVLTLHSFLNLKVYENYSTGETECTPTGAWEIFSNVLIVCDEASMNNASTMDYLEKGTENNCKILFVGDAYQLSPVKEEESLAFADNISKSFLTEKVRNSHQPALMNLCEQAKQTVIDGIFRPIVEVPGVIDFVSGDHQLKGVLQREFLKERIDRRILAYRNDRVIAYNEYVRSLRGYLEPFVVGEILTNNQNCIISRKVSLYTDQMLIITDVAKAPKRHDLLKDHSFPMLYLSLKDAITDREYIVPVFKDPDDRTVLMKHFADLKQWRSHFKIKNNFPDLRQTAASTTHKAQGSTYHSVILDLEDLGTATNRNQIARMFYVGVSRPTTRLYLRGHLPDRLYDNDEEE